MADPTTDRERVADALELVALVVERWPRPELNDDQLKRYAQDIADFDPAVMRAAIDAHHRDGQHFQPTAGELRNRAARLELAPPEWVDVRRQLVQRRIALRDHEPAPWTCPVVVCDGSGIIVDAENRGPSTRCECWPQRVESRKLAETLHPLVREFIADDFITWTEIDKIGQAQGDRDTLTLEAQARTKWEAFANRAVESRVLASIDSAPALLRLEQARDEDAPRQVEERGRIARPNFAAALPRPE